MPCVEDYIYEFEEPQQEILLHLHQLLTLEFGLKENIRFKIPFYDHINWVCYLRPFSCPKNKTGISLSFVKGNFLSDPNNLLKSRKRKRVCDLEIYTLSKLPETYIKSLIQEAIILDETTPFKFIVKK